MSENEAIALKWHADVQGLKTNEAGDELIYLYDNSAIEQAIYLALRYSDFTNQLINCHPDKVRFLINALTEALEEKEWALELGSIRLSFEYETKTLVFEGISKLSDKLPIRLALELTSEET
mgnify:CR=1 FL=1|jgi:hypothetical protein